VFQVNFVFKVVFLWMKQKNPLPVSAGHALSAQNEKSLNGVTVHISPQRAKHESQSDEQILSTLA